MIHRSISNIAQICSLKGIKRAVISPGSRSAPLSISFFRHPEIECFVVNDERSAAFIGLGMALASGIPTVLICTSGSAAYNYSPAIAEAFFQQVPLLVLTADRPPEWIDQFDGQTIRQQDIYGKHVKKFYQAPVSLEHTDAQWHLERMTSEAINNAVSYPEGPVHMNVPFREPFYPETDEIEYSKNIRIIEISSTQKGEIYWGNEILSEWKNAKNIIIIAGQGKMDQELINQVDQFSKYHSIPVIADVISNFHTSELATRHQDLFLLKGNQELKPDLVISFGKSVISKNLKVFLRKYQPARHWHIHPHAEAADTYQSLTRIIQSDPADFFRSYEKLPAAPNPINDSWRNQDIQVSSFINKFLKDFEFNEIRALQIILKSIQQKTNLHLANSMSVRYVNYLGIKNSDIEVFGNRGTSGIDGATSTAIGCAQVTPGLINILITGDMAFFYDRNAFWNNLIPENLRIVLLNNHAGVIFGNIPGPSALPEEERETLFEGNQPLTAELTAKEFGLKYYNCRSDSELEEVLPDFLSSNGGAGILEIETDKTLNKSIFKALIEKYTSYE